MECSLSSSQLLHRYKNMEENVATFQCLISYRSFFFCQPPEILGCLYNLEVGADMCV